jgi:hypothetical protein
MDNKMCQLLLKDKIHVSADPINQQLPCFGDNISLQWLRPLNMYIQPLFLNKVLGRMSQSPLPVREPRNNRF